MTQQTQMENFLDALTDAVLSEQHNFEDIIRRYDVSEPEATYFVTLLRNLHRTFIPKQPSDEFVSNLKAELMGHRTGMLARLRYLPGRVQIAAVLAVIAGFVLITRRRLTVGSDESAEIPVLQQ